MQVMENDFRKRPVKLRNSGNGYFSLGYPKELAESLKFSSGQRFESFINNKGEIFFRPILEPEDA